MNWRPRSHINRLSDRVLFSWFPLTVVSPPHSTNVSTFVLFLHSCLLYCFHHIPQVTPNPNLCPSPHSSVPPLSWLTNLATSAFFPGVFKFPPIFFLVPESSSLTGPFQPSCTHWTPVFVSQWPNPFIFKELPRSSLSSNRFLFQFLSNLDWPQVYQRGYSHTPLPQEGPPVLLCRHFWSLLMC